jgi:Mitochondrial protein up-regulated during meiosis
MPTLLQTPLPQEILSPHITLHLFPSTHPHLPTVSGRVAYIAALWTAPMAWGRVPIVGNVKLHILSERMIKSSLHASPASSNSNAEKLIVRWKTCSKERAGTTSGSIADTPHSTTSSSTSTDDSEFFGLFIFEFDELGRVLHHTIEHADEGENWDRNTAKVISVTEWLLSKARGGARKSVEEEGLALGCEMIERRGGNRRRD